MPIKAIEQSINRFKNLRSLALVCAAGLSIIGATFLNSSAPIEKTSLHQSEWRASSAQKNPAVHRLGESAIADTASCATNVSFARANYQDTHMFGTRADKPNTPREDTYFLSTDRTITEDLKPTRIRGIAMYEVTGLTSNFVTLSDAAASNKIQLAADECTQTDNSRKGIKKVVVDQIDTRALDKQTTLERKL